MNPRTVLGAIVVAVLFFFGIIFALASVYEAMRLVVAAMFFAVGFGILYYMARKPRATAQILEVSGTMKTAALKCPNCSASIDASQIKIVSGLPYVTCPYCGRTSEVIEEPKW